MPTSQERAQKRDLGSRNYCSLSPGPGFVTGAYGAGTVMPKVDKNADGTYAVLELLKNPDPAPIRSPVLHDNWAPLALVEGTLRARTERAESAAGGEVTRRG